MDDKPKCEHRRQSIPGVPGGQFPCADPECRFGPLATEVHVPVNDDGLWYKREKREDGTWGWVIATDKP
jgi:hypothetical protein